NDILAQKGTTTTATVYINRELKQLDVKRIRWHHATNLVITSHIGFADILSILHNSPNIRAIEANKVIERLDYETFYLYDLLNGTKAVDDKELCDLATIAATYDQETPANMCAMLEREAIDCSAVHILRRWAHWYNDWLKRMSESNLYHVYRDRHLSKDVRYRREAGHKKPIEA
ncbi:hypothetical protein LPJ59_007190, partial [Coemansia sp. RSA 2399]